MLNEGIVIQQCLHVPSENSLSANIDHLYRRFVDHMSRGNVKAAIKVIDSTNHSGTPLKLDMPVNQDSPTWTVYNELLKKHPPSQPAHPGALKPLLEKDTNFHAVIFESLDGTVIRSAALRFQGSAGPSGLDAYRWRHLCTSFNRHLMICVIPWL